MTTGKLARYAAALTIGVIAGWIAARIGVPLPWLLGPMIANTVAALAQAPVAGPLRLRPFVIPIIGVMLGSGFYPEIIAQVPGWGVTLAMLPVFIALAGGAGFAFYRYVGGYDPVTAFFAAMPGGFNEMILLGGENGGDERRIALAHASRILVVVTLVVIYFALVLGVTSADAEAPGVALADVALFDSTVLAACAVLGFFLGKRLGLPAAALLGPMILSALVHVTGFVETPPPTLLIIAAQVIIGTVIGCRFVGSTLAEIRRDLTLGAGAAAVMLVVAVVCAEIVVLLSGTPLSQTFLAFSPGGLTEMSLLAVALGQDIAYVSLAHVARIGLVVIAAPVAFRLFRR